MLLNGTRKRVTGATLTAVSVYGPSQTMAGIATVAVVFGIINLLSVGTWAVLGCE